MFKVTETNIHLYFKNPSIAMLTRKFAYDEDYQCISDKFSAIFIIEREYTVNVDEFYYYSFAFRLNFVHIYTLF